MNSTSPAAQTRALAKAMKEENRGLDASAVQALSKLYNEKKGDLGKITAVTGMRFKVDASPKNAQEFATGVLSGHLIAD